MKMKKLEDGENLPQNLQQKKMTQAGQKPINQNHLKEAIKLDGATRALQGPMKIKIQAGVKITKPMLQAIEAGLKDQEVLTIKAREGIKEIVEVRMLAILMGKRTLIHMLVRQLVVAHGVEPKVLNKKHKVGELQSPFNLHLMGGINLLLKIKSRTKIKNQLLQGGAKGERALQMITEDGQKVSKSKRSPTKMSLAGVTKVL